MKVSHTPGPWTVCFTPNAGLFGGYLLTNAQEISFNEAAANADLISAAPDLLDALRKSLPYVKGAYECAFPDEVENQYIVETIEQAIRKATGE